MYLASYYCLCVPHTTYYRREQTQGDYPCSWMPHLALSSTKYTGSVLLCHEQTCSDVFLLNTAYSCRESDQVLNAAIWEAL